MPVLHVGVAAKNARAVPIRPLRDDPRAEIGYWIERYQRDLDHDPHRYADLASVIEALNFLLEHARLFYLNREGYEVWIMAELSTAQAVEYMLVFEDEHGAEWDLPEWTKILTPLS